MNHMTLIARFAALLCARFTALSQPISKAQDSTQRINSSTRPSQGEANKGSHLRFYIKSIKTSLTNAVLYRLEPLKGLTEGRRRVALGVAAVIGIALSIPMASADSGSIDAIEPRDYVRIALPHKEAVCLARLIGKESAWQTDAVGNLSSPSKNYTYGLLQLKNPIAKDATAIEQIHLGLKYIDHRYDGDTCKAWTHWIKRGWH